mmetsp:Transcript_38015/g.103731  ORF Transcript_38015/g.103731 Transcript_38015/m.103731 type:complete len:139 (+) Transcript_38015:52-468(+)
MAARDHNPALVCIMHLMTVVGAGSFGLVELFNPALLTTYLGKPESSPYMMSDLFVGSVSLAFAISSYLALKSSPAAWAPVLKMQGIYKTIWCTGFLLLIAQGKEVWSFWNSFCFAVMAFYAVGDACTFVFMVGKDKAK